MTEKRMGRPKGQTSGPLYTRRLQVLISDEQQAWVDAEATRRQITVGELIRTLIEQERTDGPT